MEPGRLEETTPDGYLPQHPARPGPDPSHADDGFFIVLLYGAFIAILFALLTASC